MQNIRFLVLLLVVLVSNAWYRLEDYGDHIELTLEYGSTTITEPVVLDIIASDAFERLKLIHQYGVTRFAREKKEYTRYEHSLGVFFMLRKAGCALDEQLAGLLHDVSHTVFSHVGDLVFHGNLKQESHQDVIHTWFLRVMGLAAILEKHGFGHVATAHPKHGWPALGKKNPNLSADRLEYNIKGALVEGWLTDEQAKQLFDDVVYRDEEWFFVDQESAHTFSMISLRLSEVLWS